MQVSAISVRYYTAFGNVGKPDENTESAEIPFKTIKTPSQKNNTSSTDFDNINEWKDFCHNQILSDKIDYMA